MDKTRPGFFCILPWTQLHLWPEGNVYPCCMYDSHHPVGNLQHQTIQEVWHGPEFTQLRKTLMKGAVPSGCRKCFEHERASFPSLRKDSNQLWEGQISQILKEFDQSSTALNIRMVDLRTSNLCNFRCRTCFPKLSSSLYSEFEQLGMSDMLPAKPVVSVTDDRPELWEEIGQLLGQVQYVYFAGGEPLICEDHYRMLEMLLSQNQNCIKLSYITNFSNLSFKGRSVLDLWNQFSSVDVAVSLDGFGAKGEYIRKGLRWDRMIENMRALKKNCPRVHMAVTVTVSIFNAFHLTDLHRELTHLGLIEPQDFYINILQDPEHFRIDALPTPIKRQLMIRYYEHLKDFVVPNVNLTLNPKFMASFMALCNFLESRDRWDRLKHEMRRSIQLFDQLRNESFLDVFPELAFIFENEDNLLVDNVQI